MKRIWKFAFALNVVAIVAFPWLASIVYGSMRSFETPSEASGTPTLMSFVLCFFALVLLGVAVSFKVFGRRK
jgi:hypothetical protein